MITCSDFHTLWYVCYFIEVKQRVIIILGMHRSGTSMLAGTLKKAGVSFGEVMNLNEDNKLGNQEHPAILHMHQDLLKLNGGSWINPPEKIIWHALHSSVKQLFIWSFRDVNIWGFKDPRTLFTLSGWLKSLPNAELVGIFRHPALVASSLSYRNGMNYKDGVDLWVKYNARLLWFVKQRKAKIIEFSNATTQLLHSVGYLLTDLGLDPHCANSFYNSKLQSHHNTNFEVNSLAMKMYYELKKHSICKN